MSQLESPVIQYEHHVSEYESHVSEPKLDMLGAQLVLPFCTLWPVTMPVGLSEELGHLGHPQSEHRSREYPDP
nr:hypothetical protein [Tanacetum cinerariifolium]